MGDIIMKTIQRIKKDNGVIRKFGNWSLVFLDNGNIEAIGDWRNVSITVYGMMPLYGWKADYPEILPESIKSFLWDNYENLAILQNEY